MGMYEVVEKMFYGVSFIAIGGTVAMIFFFIFAPSILGSRKIHEQLEKIQQQAEEMKEQLKRIAEHLEKEKKNSKEED
jgi:uncharacterized membrane protein